ncbi:hypothetical protein EJ02DRAFT_111919 [Clathrospora elynae]|uniref:Uncharacterized protein n=1 Tax=Clathrospora elynae TaxID=706981 RepID=A0A6A5S6T7_9PLEO|nr:hypothetical protein EJ02DRAFT_111919 [Clathrospora elynae]
MPNFREIRRSGFSSKRHIHFKANSDQSTPKRTSQPPRRKPAWPQFQQSHRVPDVEALCLSHPAMSACLPPLLLDDRFLLNAPARLHAHHCTSLRYISTWGRGDVVINDQKDGRRNRSVCISEVGDGRLWLVEQGKPLSLLAAHIPEQGIW